MPQPVTVQHSRAVPVPVDTAFARVLPMPLTLIFSRRYGPLPPVRRVDQQGEWAHVGQVRTIVTSDGGTMREELLTVDPPHSFGYRLTDLTGPLKPLVSAVDGQWIFREAGTGTEITWQWTLHPRSAMSARLMPVVARLWRGYARQALEELSDRLVTRS
jgi:hypothetical protein